MGVILYISRVTAEKNTMLSKYNFKNGFIESQMRYWNKAVNNNYITQVEMFCVVIIVKRTVPWQFQYFGAMRILIRIFNWAGLHSKML